MRPRRNRREDSFLPPAPREYLIRAALFLRALRVHERRVTGSRPMSTAIPGRPWAVRVGVAARGARGRRTDRVQGLHRIAQSPRLLGRPAGQEGESGRRGCVPDTRLLRPTRRFGRRTVRHVASERQSVGAGCRSPVVPTSTAGAERFIVAGVVAVESACAPSREQHLTALRVTAHGGCSAGGSLARVEPGVDDDARALPEVSAHSRAGVPYTSTVK